MCVCVCVFFVFRRALYGELSFLHLYGELSPSATWAQPPGRAGWLVLYHAPRNQGVQHQWDLGVHALEFD